MKSIDPNKLHKSVREELIRQINELDLQGFNFKQGFDSECILAEAAFKQIPVNNTMFENFRTRATTDQEWNVASVVDESEDDEDFAYSFYTPLASSQGEAWVGRLMKGLIPQNDKFYGFDLKHHSLLKGPLKELREPVEKAFNNFAKYAFNDIKLKPKFLRFLTQLTVYGNAPYMLDYNPDLKLLDFVNKNMKNFAIYPAREEISQANFILRHNLLYSDLLQNPEISKKTLKKIKSERILIYEPVDYMTAPQEYWGRMAPKGYVPATTIFMPSFIFQSDDDKVQDVVLRNILVTVVRNQYVKEDPDGDQLSTIILKITQLDRRADNPLGFATFGPTMAGTIYYQSKIYQMLPYQGMSNLYNNVAAQAAVTSISPPLMVVGSGDEEENFPYVFSPRAIWPVKATTDIEVVETQPRLDLFLEMNKYIEASAQKQSGIMGDATGYSTNPSERKTAFQSGVQKESSEVRTDIPPNFLEDAFLSPFVTNYFTGTQQFIKSQVDARMTIFNEVERSSKKTIDPNKKWDLIINGDPENDIQGADLLKQFLIYSGIEEEIQAKIEDLQMTNPELAAQITAVYNFDLLYKIITERLSNSAVLIEGNSSQLRNQQSLDAISTVFTLLKGMKDDPATAQAYASKVYNLSEIEPVLSKLADMPDVKLITDIPPQAMQVPPVVQPGAEQQTQGPEQEQPV